VKLIKAERVSSTRTPAIRWQIALAFLAFVLIGANDGGIGVILPSLRIYYAIDKATLGFLFIAGTAGYLTAGFSSGLILEKLGQRSFLMLGGVAFVLGMLTISLGPLFGLLLVAFYTAGFGIGIIDAGLNAYIARLPNSTPVLNYLHAFYAAGAFVGPIIASGIIAAGKNWNILYMVWIVTGLVVLAGFAMLYNQRSETADQDQDTTNPGGNLLAAAFKIRIVWFAAIFLLFYTGAEVTINNWGYTYLTEYRHQEIILSGGMVSAYWLGLMFGRLVLGKLSKRVSNRSMIQGCLFGVMIGLSIIWLTPGSLPAAVGLCIAGFCLGPIFPTTIALMPELLPDRIVATAIGFLASFAAAGSALMPWVAGNLAQSIGLWTLMPFVMALALADLGIWLFLERKSNRLSDLFKTV
jgi:fucose permease